MSTNKWLVEELRSLFGFQEVDEMASALLQNFPPNDPDGSRKAYLEELLGKNSATEKLSEELTSRLVVETDSSVRVGAKKKKKQGNNANAAVFNPNKKTIYNEAAEPPQLSQPSQQNKFPDKKLSQKEKARLNKGSQNVQVGGIKISYEGKQQRKNTTAANQQASVDEDGFERFDFEMNVPPIQLTHSATPTGTGLIVNCLSCGYVTIVAAKGEKSKIWGECTSCGAFLERGSEITTAPGFANALALKVIFIFIFSFLTSYMYIFGYFFACIISLRTFSQHKNIYHSQPHPHQRIDWCSTIWKAQRDMQFMTMKQITTPPLRGSVSWSKKS
jgi:hypothetical protein